MSEPTAKTQPEENEEMTADYANNTMFESTIWDLKLIFGEFSQRPNSVEWHTSITVPWAQAKLMIYYLQANVAAYEINTGKIKMADQVLPPEWPAPSAKQTKDPKAVETFETLKNLATSFWIA